MWRELITNNITQISFSISTIGKIPTMWIVLEKFFLYSLLGESIQIGIMTQPLVDHGKLTLLSTNFNLWIKCFS